MSNLVNNETITFTTSDGRFDFTVRKEFFTKRLWRKLATEKEEKEELDALIKEMSSFPVYSLMNEYKMSNYLHNTNGYAVFNRLSGHGEYFINGLNNTKKHKNKEAVKKDIFDIIGD